jgi:hypothetical protein
MRSTSRRSDRRLLKGTRCLRRDTADQRGTSNERNGCLVQEDALHYRNFVHNDLTGYLPEDVPGLRFACKFHLGGRGLLDAS